VASPGAGDNEHGCGIACLLLPLCSSARLQGLAPGTVLHT